jgi:hypothetical protein
MGLFDIFKKPKTIQDEFFGLLIFIETRKDPSESYFEGKRLFYPIDEEIECFITADLSGPSTQQKAFYKRVETNYEDLINKAKPLITNEFRNWKGQFEMRDFNTEFKVVSISIPRVGQEELIWDMTFEAVHDDNHLITVNFKDFEADSIMIDG